VAAQVSNFRRRSEQCSSQSYLLPSSPDDCEGKQETTADSGQSLVFRQKLMIMLAARKRLDPGSRCTPP